MEDLGDSCIRGIIEQSLLKKKKHWAPWKQWWSLHLGALCAPSDHNFWPRIKVCSDFPSLPSHSWKLNGGSFENSFLGTAKIRRLLWNFEDNDKT